MSVSLSTAPVAATDIATLCFVLQKLLDWHVSGELTSSKSTTWTVASADMDEHEEGEEEEKTLQLYTSSP